MFLQQLSTRKQKQTTIILMGVLWEYSSKIWLIVLKFFFISSLFLHLSSTLAPTSKLHEDVTGDKANSLPSSAQSWPRTHNELRPRARHLLIRQMWGAGGGGGGGQFRRLHTFLPDNQALQLFHPWGMPSYSKHFWSSPYLLAFSVYTVLISTWCSGRRILFRHYQFLCKWTAC